MLSALTGRVFLMRNVHEDALTLFQSRWALSYLRGPLGRDHRQEDARERCDAPLAADTQRGRVNGPAPTADLAALPPLIQMKRAEPPFDHDPLLRGGEHRLVVGQIAPPGARQIGAGGGFARAGVAH